MIEDDDWDCCDTLSQKPTRPGDYATLQAAKHAPDQPGTCNGQLYEVFDASMKPRARIDLQTSCTIRNYRENRSLQNPMFDIVFDWSHHSHYSKSPTQMVRVTLAADGLHLHSSGVQGSF